MEVSSKQGAIHLRVELDQHDSLQGQITIRLYEPGPRQRIKKLSKQEIASGVTVVRILMPEGILWDDPSAFSGSMEDSESITRYNTDSGLVWKEYNRRLWTIPSNTATGSVFAGCRDCTQDRASLRNPDRCRG